MAEARIELIFLHLAVSALGVPSVHFHSVYRKQNAGSVTALGAMNVDWPVFLVIDQLQKLIRFGLCRWDLRIQPDVDVPHSSDFRRPARVLFWMFTQVYDCFDTYRGQF